MYKDDWTAGRSGQSVRVGWLGLATQRSQNFMIQPHVRKCEMHRWNLAAHARWWRVVKKKKGGCCNQVAGLGTRFEAVWCQPYSERQRCNTIRKRHCSIYVQCTYWKAISLPTRQFQNQVTRLHVNQAVNPRLFPVSLQSLGFNADTVYVQLYFYHQY